MVRHLLLGLAVCAVTPTHAAENLLDPTRPAAITQGSGGMVDVLPMAAEDEVQSIILVPGKKPRALVGGQWVEQGKRYGSWRVLKITAGSVILRELDGARDVTDKELKMTPGVEKTRPVPIKPKRMVEIN